MLFDGAVDVVPMMTIRLPVLVCIVVVPMGRPGRLQYTNVYETGAAVKKPLVGESQARRRANPMAHKKLSRNAPCPCGSGKKYKHCCYGKGVEDNLGLGSGRQQPQYPIGTVAMYGPDDKTTTKIAAGVILHDGAEAIMQRWVATDVTTNPKVQQELKDFFLQHGVKQVAMSQGNMGCPHEEGEDFPHGEDCPFCPFWKGKQGSNRKD